MSSVISISSQKSLSWYLNLSPWMKKTPTGSLTTHSMNHFLHGPNEHSTSQNQRFADHIEGSERVEGIEAHWRETRKSFFVYDRLCCLYIKLSELIPDSSTGRKRSRMQAQDKAQSSLTLCICSSSDIGDDVSTERGRKESGLKVIITWNTITRCGLGHRKKYWYSVSLRYTKHVGVGQSAIHKNAEEIEEHTKGQS